MPSGVVFQDRLYCNGRIFVLVCVLFPPPPQGPVRACHICCVTTIAVSGVTSAVTTSTIAGIGVTNTTVTTVGCQFTSRTQQQFWQCRLSHACEYICQGLELTN